MNMFPAQAFPLCFSELLRWLPPRTRRLVAAAGEWSKCGAAALGPSSNGAVDQEHLSVFLLHCAYVRRAVVTTMHRPVVAGSSKLQMATSDHFVVLY
jgi:hypothetical protein